MFLNFVSIEIQDYNVLSYHCTDFHGYLTLLVDVSILSHKVTYVRLTLHPL